MGSAPSSSSCVAVAVSKTGEDAVVALRDDRRYRRRRTIAIVVAFGLLLVSVSAALVGFAVVWEKNK